jgi:hypothetical protein
MPGVFQQLMPGFEEQEVKELPPDIVSVESLTVIPTPPINTEDQFSISFMIKNQDDVNSALDVRYELYDSGLCEIDETDTDPKKSVAPKNFAPLQEEFHEWTFNAPTDEQIAKISTKCPIRFKVDYNFDATSQIDVNVITKDRLDELHRSGETASFTPTLTVGRGPVKIYMSFGASLPVRVDNKIPLYILVEDKGRGLYGEIPQYALKLKITPDDFVTSDCISGNSKFVEQGEYIVNNDTIDLIRKKTVQLRCSLVAPDESKVSFEKTYYITAELNYDYTITSETDVAIKPTG